jgi:hypothetical protein
MIRVQHNAKEVIVEELQQIMIEQTNSIDEIGNRRRWQDADSNEYQNRRRVQSQMRAKRIAAKRRHLLGFHRHVVGSMRIENNRFRETP